MIPAPRFGNTLQIAVLALLAGLAAMAVMPLATLGISLLIPMFTRVQSDDVLDNPNRRLAFEYVVENPGTGFRELLRGTGMASGTARHHLSILQDRGLVIERSTGASVRLFEANHRFREAWEEIVLLREDPLSQLLAYIESSPGQCQQDILEHCQHTWQWSRSTTQHRLRRLVQGGLVMCHTMGRKCIYEPVDSPSIQIARDLNPVMMEVYA